MKKTMATLLILSMLLVMMPFSALAITSTEQADALHAANLFQGTGTGYDLPGILNRMQGITLALRAQGLETAVQAQTSAQIAVTLGRVYDVGDIPEWGRPYVAYALNQSPAITTGVSVQSDGRVVFAPNQVMGGKELITFMARAMGYEATLESALTTAVNKTMLSASQVVNYSNIASLTREQAVDVLYSCVKNGIVATGEGTLIQKLVSQGVVTETAAAGFGYAAATPTPTQTADVESLSVSDVLVENCRQIKVIFSNTLNEDSVLTSAFVIKDKGTDTLPLMDAALLADGKSVRLTFAEGYALTNGTDAYMTIKRTLRTPNGVYLDAIYDNDALSVFDSTFPTVESLTVVGKKTLKLAFNEPVWNGSSDDVDAYHFSLLRDGQEQGVESVALDQVERTAFITLMTDMSKGSYTLTVNAQGRTADSLQDFAGYKMVPVDKAFTYSPDLSVPTVKILSVNQYTRAVEVKFSKPVYGSSIRLYQMVPNVDAYGSNTLSKTEANATDTWTFTMKNALSTGSVKFYLVTTANEDDPLMDLYGVAVPDTTLTYTVVADTKAPTVTSVTASVGSTITIVFSEELDPDEAEKRSNYEIRNASGVQVNIADAQLQSDGQTVRLLAGITAGNTYTIKVKSMSDLSGNVMSAYSVSRTVEDDTNPKVTSAYAIPAQKKVYITFSKPMNLTEMGDKINYLVDPNGGTDAFRSMTATESVTVTDSTHVVLAFSSALSNPSIKMAAIHDQTGMKLGSDMNFEYTGESGNLLNLGGESVSLETVELVDRDLLQLTFNTRMTGLQKTDILIRQKSNGSAFAYPVSVSSTVGSQLNASGATVMIVKLSKSLNPDATYDDNTASEAVEIQVNATGTYSSSGALLSSISHADALPVLDRIGGTIAHDSSGNERISWNDFNGDGRLDTVVVQYEEAVLESSLSLIHYTVDGYTVTGVSTDADGFVSAGHQGDHAATAKYVILNISKAGQTLDAGLEPEVTQLYPITDVVGNVME